MSEEASIPLTSIIICIIYLLPRFLAYSGGTAHISFPIFRPVFCFLQRLSSILWCLYWGAPWGETVRAGEPAAGPPAGGCRSGAVHRACGTANSAGARLNTTNTAKHQRRKRKRREDDEKGRPEQIPKLDAGQSSSPFACPFYLYDRHEWHNCLRNYTLNRIVDVRLHLQRAHSLAPQCPICGEEFKEDSAERGSADDRFSAHVQLRTCQPLPSPPPPRHGLTRDQFETVRAIATRRNGRRGTDPAAEKWFEIWDIIFPATLRPLSPYINDHPDVQRIRDMNNDILAGEQWRELTLPTRGSSPSLQHVSRNTIITITERLVAFYRRMSQHPDQAVPEAVSNTTAADTPVISSTDDSLQQPQDWEVVSAPSQPAQAIGAPFPQHPAAAAAAAAAATGQNPWIFQPTPGYSPSGGQSHNNFNNTAQMDRPLSPFASAMGYLTDVPDLPDSILDFPDVDDHLEPPAGSGSPSRFFSND